jgi:alkaline phosphatase D
MRDGTRYVWGPSSAFLVGPKMAPQMPGERWLGAARYTFEGANVTVEYARVEGLHDYWIDDVVHEVYPPHV